MIGDETIDQRRARLSAEIARQRGDLAQAYSSLHKPIEIGETGLQAFGFIRKNTWVFVAVPAALRVASFFMGIRGGKSARPEPRQRQSVEREIERERVRPKGMLGTAVKLGGYGWKLFNVYRRVRKFIP